MKLPSFMKLQSMPLNHLYLRIVVYCKYDELFTYLHFEILLCTFLFMMDVPQELMPEEGLSKKQRHQLAQMEYAKKMQAKDQEVRNFAFLRHDLRYPLSYPLHCSARPSASTCNLSLNVSFSDRRPSDGCSCLR